MIGRRQARQADRQTGMTGRRAQQGRRKDRVMYRTKFTLLTTEADPVMNKIRIRFSAMNGEHFTTTLLKLES
jgi:hypothetical protein